MPSINPRARSREDRAGDPLDGMVNLFDLGIVLALGFMIAALAALDLNLGSISGEGAPVVLPPGSTAEDVEIPEGSEIIGQGREFGTVYQLSDGRLVLVTPDGEQTLPGTETTPAPDTESPIDPSTQTPPTGQPGSTAPPSTVDPTQPGSSFDANPNPSFSTE